MRALSNKEKSKSKLYYDRQSVCRSVLVSGTHLRPATNFSHSLFDYFFLQIQVCTFQFLPGIASAAFLRSESHGTHEHSLSSLFFRLPQPGGPTKNHSWSCLCNSEADKIEIITSPTSSVVSIDCFLAMDILLLLI
jgi:hypothetical protein